MSLGQVLCRLEFPAHIQAGPPLSRHLHKSVQESRLLKSSTSGFLICPVIERRHSVCVFAIPTKRFGLMQRRLPTCDAFDRHILAREKLKRQHSLSGWPNKERSCLTARRWRGVHTKDGVYDKHLLTQQTVDDARARGSVRTTLSPKAIFRELQMY